MRLNFNHRELAFLAHQTRDKFDKEGILLLKEKQDGLFKKGEVYVDRWCRLRGNLLFYFRTKDPRSEPVGVFVLERCTVELDAEEELPYSFMLNYDAEEKAQYLAAQSEQERDHWIEALHIASYECMKMQMQSLREQLRAKTGKDPIDNPNPSVLEEYVPGAASAVEEMFVEMCISCDNLPLEPNGNPPNTYAVVYIMTPPQQQWRTYSHTETVEKSSNPVYLTTVGFSYPITMATRVKLVVQNVKELVNNIITQIGSAIFTVSDLLTAAGYRLRLRLNSTDFEDAGHVIVMAWQTESHVNLQQENNAVIGNKESVEYNSVDKSMANLAPKGKTKRLEMLKPLYDNIISKTYRFPTNTDEQELSVHEYMGESRLTYSLPRNLLKLWVEEEKSRIEHLQDLGELDPKREVIKRTHEDLAAQLINTYLYAAQCFGLYKGPPFKPSAKKGHKEVEFVPTNLHLQRMWVQNEAKQTSACYDIMTVGAFTAYAQKYKHGGLRRLIKQLREHHLENLDGRNKLEQINHILNDLTVLSRSVHQFCDGLCAAAVKGDSADLSNYMGELSDKTRQLIQVCEDPLVAQALDMYMSCKPAKISTSRPQSDSMLQVKPPAPMRTNTEKSYKWSGTDFVKSPTEEPWDMTRLNSEASLVCVLSKIEDLVGHKTAPGEMTKWLEELSPSIIKLRSCVEVMSKRARSSLTFLTIEETSQNVALMHTIKYRRDVVFSQAVTAASAAFMTKLRSSMMDETFLRQLFQIGVLMEFESLLSCHGDELGMLEDMSVGVADLTHIQFRVVQSKRADAVMPTVAGNRTGYTIDVPVPEQMFHLLPKEIQRGHTVKVVPVVFSVGINEQATLAETFGSTSVQESVNLESWQVLNSYCEKYCEVIGEPDCKDKNGFPLEQLMRHLHINVVNKKSKNVEILHLAAEICRRLNGIHFVSCKSAKDRTSMGVTLEQVQLLQREHDLASYVFMHALDCMRSEGVRRENTIKNTGSRKYAFNTIQLRYFPKLYRPPHGTFGNIQT